MPDFMNDMEALLQESLNEDIQRETVDLDRDNLASDLIKETESGSPGFLESLGGKIQAGLEQLGDTIENVGRTLDEWTGGVKDLHNIGENVDEHLEERPEGRTWEDIRDLSSDLPAGAEPIGRNTWMDGAGIIHNGPVDTLYNDLMSDFQRSFKESYGPGAWMDGAGIIHDSKIDSDVRDVMDEQMESLKDTYGEGVWMDGAGIIHNDAADQAIDELTRDLQAENVKLEEQIQYNWEHGIYPPIYDGFVSNPYYDPAGSNGSMAVMDAFCGMMTMDAPDYVGYVPTAEESMREFDFNQSMADSYFSDGLGGMADVYDSRAEQNLKDMEFYNSIHG